jgi:protein-tyrosine-phosphatase
MGGAGMPASNEIVSICARKGIYLGGHRSRALTSGEVELADYIFAMSKSHCERILEICPEAAEKCQQLDAGDEIGDPIGAGDNVYEKCAQQIESALKERIDEILL